MKYPPEWLPNPVQWSNYPKTLTYVPFGLYLKNTLFYCALTVVGAVLSNSVIAYGFSRIRWPGRDFVFFIVLGTMMVPWFVTLIPLYITFAHYGWIGTFKPLIVPTFFGFPFYIFLLRQFLRGIPEELSDAATIDGCSEFSIFWRIIIPLVKPALIVVALFEFMGRWNDYVGPLIYLNDPKKYTIAIGLTQFYGEVSVKWGLLMAATTITVVPIMIAFLIAQRAFIQGITLTGLKG